MKLKQQIIINFMTIVLFYWFTDPFKCGIWTFLPENVNIQILVYNFKELPDILTIKWGTFESKRGATKNQVTQKLVLPLANWMCVALPLVHRRIHGSRLRSLKSTSQTFKFTLPFYNKRHIYQRRVSFLTGTDMHE